MTQTAKQHFKLNSKILIEILQDSFEEGVYRAKVEIIDNTPIDKGDLKANWKVRETKTLGQWVFIIFNDLPYAHKIEYGLYAPSTTGKIINGYSWQAPFGVLRWHEDDYLKTIKAHVQTSLRSF